MRTNAKDSAVTIATACAQLKAMLANARSLDHLTVETLVRSYRVPVKEIEYELAIARQKRGAQ
ncbi:hypothetical protein [Sphingobium sp. YR768]|uniref:hypothetical protein n=1 Tax=Sphingobium sp. YR768 TaxID=1884365 RepID=UPI000B837303|nr:hypothetical protein [Sphingobium sp. YR768]